MRPPPDGVVSGGPLDTSPGLMEPSFGDGALEIGGLLGRGGMGEVHEAWDPRLRRAVAIKRAVDVETTRALIREARITARLDHPNILPVHGAGNDGDGRAWVTMRIAAGRTLADALAATPAREDRLRFVRAMLGVAHAVAYAHRQGILHRDLTPSNILIGPLGEAVVADWGLALSLEEAAVGARAGVGTPGFMSPEQERGGPLDARSDVYALGALLRLVAAGAEAPELSAIAERACATEPGRRYPSADALAEDLGAWLDGRRVSAHAYRPAELFVRLVRAWRAPLLVGVAALFLLIGIGGAAWARAARERDRALRAEEESDRFLAQALVAQAVSAADASVELNAELLAVHALERQESPMARGVLARYGGPVGVRSVARAALPPCAERVPSPDGRLYLCRTATALTLYERGTGLPLRTLPGDFVSSAVNDAGVVIAQSQDRNLMRWSVAGAEVLDIPPSASGNIGVANRPDTVTVSYSSASSILGFDGVELARLTVCEPNNQRAAATLSDGRLVSGCSDGRLQITALDGTRLEQGSFPVELGVPTFVGLDPADESVVGIGTAKGHVVLYRLGPMREVERYDLGGTSIRRVSLRGDLMLVEAESAAVTVVDRRSREIRLQLRLNKARADWLPDGDLLVLADELQQWSFPDVPPRVYQYPEGVGALAWSVDGRWLAVGLGSGGVHVEDVRTGDHVATLADAKGVVKDLSFTPDGSALVVAVAYVEGILRYDTTTWALNSATRDAATRRIVVDAAGTAIASTWKPGVYVLERDAEVRFEGQYELWDLETDLRGNIIVGIERGRKVVRLTPGNPIAYTVIGEVAASTAVAPLPDGVLAATDETAIRLGWDGSVKHQWPLPVWPGDIVVSPDTRWAVFTGREGEAYVYRVADGALVAELTGHRSRVGAAAFSPDSRFIATAGWDGVVRLHSTDELERPAAELRTAVERTWARSLADVLERGL